jgi:hypothetical protein
VKLEMELHNFQPSPNIITVRIWKMLRAGHVARIGNIRIEYEAVIRNLMERAYLRALDKD